MNTSSAYLSVGGVDVDVVYKDIKNLHVGVYPPLGRVRVAAPKRLGDDQVRMAVVSRLTWIRRQRERLHAAQRQSVREMVTGESHFVWGNRLRLMVAERSGRPSVGHDRGRLLLVVAEGTDAAYRRELLDRWYRKELRETIPDLMGAWEQRLGVEVFHWNIRRMKTKWGSCNPETGRVWFNLELAKKHPSCLEYLMAHELMHLIERGHGASFVSRMDKVMPDWRTRRDLLNDSPLKSEKWD